MKTTNAFTEGQSLIDTILGKMDHLNEWRRRFIKETFMLFLTISNRVNFLQLGRHGIYNEATYRSGFDSAFNFLDFNMKLVSAHCSGEVVLGFDPSYISKSGKHTPGLGYYYSGTAGKYKHGLEVASIATIDLSQQTAYHLEAIQSPTAKKANLSDGRTIVDHYAEVIVSRGQQLVEQSSILVCDGYFAKIKFVDAIAESTPLTLVCRLRDDANLQYLYKGLRKKGKGRPKQYDGKINVKQIDKRRLLKEFEDENVIIHGGVVNSVGLKRNIKLAHVTFLDANGIVITTKLFFSTDIEMTGYDILRYYRARFQMEFIFRDAKQFTGLEHCQARSLKKLHFHLNASLTAVSIAKCLNRNGTHITQPKRISVSDVKTELFNHYLLQRIFSIFHIQRNINKNDHMIRSILDFGKIAA